MKHTETHPHAAVVLGGSWVIVVLCSENFIKLNKFVLSFVRCKGSTDSGCWILFIIQSEFNDLI